MLRLVATILPSVVPALADGMDDTPWGKLTLIGALVAAILAYQKRWIVPGALYDDLKNQNEELRQANESLRRTLQSAAGTAEKALSAEPPRPTQGG